MFSFGGIGATPDDHTRQCAARAAGVELELHPEAEAEIRARFGADITPNRLKMGEFPAAAASFPIRTTAFRGSAFDHHYFLPGFPQMAWPMMAWVLDNCTIVTALRPGAIAESSIIVRGAGESQLIDLMNECQARFLRLKVFSLPHMSETDRYIELGVRGDPGEVDGRDRRFEARG